jgi:phage terminase large subunit-like protein
LAKRASWLDEFRREILAFPAGRYNDQVDAFSQALNRAFNRRQGDYACLPIGGTF